MEQDGPDPVRILDKACERLFEDMWNAYTKMDKQKALELALLVYNTNKNPVCLEIINECLNSRPSQSTNVSSAQRSSSQPSSVLGKMMKIAAARSIFDMVDCQPWSDPKIIEDRFKEISRAIHPDKNGQSPESVGAMQRLTSEFQMLKKDPIGYSMRHEGLMFRDGILRPYDLSEEENEYRKNYGKEMGWVVDPGFAGGKRSYTMSALRDGSMAKGGPTVNPAALEKEDSKQLMPKVAGAPSEGWDSAMVAWNSSNAHRFDERGQYQDFSHAGVSTSKHGTSFISKNNY